MQIGFEELYVAELDQVGYELVGLIRAGAFGFYYKAQVSDSVFLPRRVNMEMTTDKSHTAVGKSKNNVTS